MIRMNGGSPGSDDSVSADRSRGAGSNVENPALRFLHRHRQITALLVYTGIAAVSYLLAYTLRFEFQVPRPHLATMFVTLPVLLLVRAGIHWAFRVSTGRWRFVGTRDVLRLGAAAGVGTVLFALVLLALPLEPSVPRSVVLLEYLLTVFLTAGVWLGYRVVFEQLRHHRVNGSAGHRRVLIVGAGEAANLLAREMVRFPTGYEVVGFVDDDPLKWGSRLHGVEVLGATADLPQIAQTFRAREIHIAVPSASPAEMRRIVELCEGIEVPFKVLPGINQVLEGRVRISQLREVRIEDLLGREPISLELPEVSQDVGGAAVLITGAAGSIGSELARQIAANRPRCLILYDQAESDLYFLQRELADDYPEMALVPMVADALDRPRLDETLRRHEVTHVFHAAAYKHVPLMEENVREAVRNNVGGTREVVAAAGEAGVRKLVLISTDKAVRPASVMGATKSVAERIVLAAVERYPGTTFMAVRFGNVLGSNGSVIPVFRRQLQEGRPLTVTHPEVTRFFMTISEAVQLILQASVLEEGAGRIAMLDMGEPIRILDLAKNLIRLSQGRTAGSDDIVFTGLRKGEKLHEALYSPDEEIIPTPVDKVSLLLRPRGSEDLFAFWSQLGTLLDELDEMEENRVRAELADILPSADRSSLKTAPAGGSDSLLA